MRWIRLLFSPPPPPPPSINVLFARGWFFGHDSGLKAVRREIRLRLFFLFYAKNPNLHQPLCSARIKLAKKWRENVRLLLLSLLSLAFFPVKQMPQEAESVRRYTVYGTPFLARRRRFARRRRSLARRKRRHMLRVFLVHIREKRGEVAVFILSIRRG